MPDCPFKTIPPDVVKTITPSLTALALSLDFTSAYQLHQWRTFTTVAGSDGILLTGLQREEVALPAFVHSHFGFENGTIGQ